MDRLDVWVNDGDRIAAYAKQVQALTARAESAEGRADGLYRALCDTVKASGGIAREGLSDTFLILGVPAEMAARKKAQEAAERERDDARQLLHDLAAIFNPHDHYDPTKLPGWARDTVDRAREADEAQAHAADLRGALGRIKAEALRDFAKSRDVEVIVTDEWSEGIQVERTATLEDLRETADRLEKEDKNGTN
jgi:hypothetical protein